MASNPTAGDGLVNGCRTATAIQSMEASSNQRAETTDGRKPQQTAAVGLYIRHCLAGEQGENVIQQAKLLEEKEDHTKILAALEEFVSPSNHFVEDSVNYFYKTRRDVSVTLPSSRRTTNRENDPTIQRLEDDEAY